MSCRRPVLPACLLSLTAAALSAQTTYVVQGGGAALQAAINAAAPNDILDVLPAIYSPVVCTKGLRIELRPGAEISDTASPPAIALTVLAIPATEQFVVTGGTVHGFAIGNAAGTVVFDQLTVPAYDVPQQQITQCTGPVVFQNVSFPYLSSYSGGELLVSGCNQVCLQQCFLPYVEVANSTVLLDEPTIRPSGIPGPGLHIVSGSATVVGGFVTGVSFLFTAIGAPAVRIDQGQLVVTRGASLQAWQPGLTTAPGIVANGGTVRLDPSVVVTGTPPTSGPGAIVITPVPFVTTGHSGNQLNANVHAAPGSAVFTFAGLPTSPYPTPWGEAWLLPTDPILDVAILPASGTSTFTRTFASVPPFVVLTMQPVVLSPAGALAIGAPVRFAWD